MKRKINRVGASTLTVSLPSKWARTYGLKQGDEIEVHEKGSCLEVWSQKTEQLEEFKKKLTKSSLSHLKSVISNAYKRGYDRIILEYDDESLLKDIQRIVDTLLGIEIVSRNKNQCEIRNIASQLESEFDNLVKTSFILTMEIANETLGDIKTGQFSRLSDILYKKDMVTKYTDFCKRILIKHRRNDNKMVFEYLIIWSLEKLANEYKYIYQFCAKHTPGKFSKLLMSFFEETNSLLHLYYQAFYEKNHDKVMKLCEKKDELLYERHYTLHSKLHKHEHVVLYHLANVVRRLWDMSGPFHGMYA